MHVVVSGRASQTDAWSARLVRDFLAETVRLAQMKLIHGPVVTERGDLVAGIALLAESHTSLHLNRRDGAFHADLFSCNDFDRDEWVAFVLATVPAPTDRVIQVVVGQVSDRGVLAPMKIPAPTVL